MKTNKRKISLIAATAGGAAIVAGIGLVGVQAATAASISDQVISSPTADRQPGDSGGPRGHGGPGGLRGPGGPMGQLLHGEDVVKEGTTIKTIEIQQGTVTKVSATSITVKSSDDFVATYVVDSDTKVGKDGKESAIAEVAVGDTVHLRGVKSNDSITAKFIMDGKPPAPAKQNA